jgi:hypothetical protein
MIHEFGLRWTEATGREGRLTLKEKLFRTRAARDHYADLVAEKERFVRFDAWLDPPTGYEEDATDCPTTR